MNAPESKRRWYPPTPGWLVAASLATSVFLLLSDRYQWCWFSQFKNLTSLFVITNIGLTLFSLLLWFIARLLFRWRFQFTIRTLLLLAVAVAIPFGWIGSRIREAEWQRQGIALVEGLGGGVYLYDRWPDLLYTPHRLFPDVIFEEVEVVTFESKNRALSATDLSEMVRLLPHVRFLDLNSTAVTDAGLQSLSGFSNLLCLSLNNTKTTDAGLEHLRNVRTLGSLELDNTSVTDAGIERMAGHRLWRLHLCRTQVTDKELAHILTRETDVVGHKLTSLALSSTKISDAGLEHIDERTELQQLLLSGTRITDAALGHLDALYDLRTLDISRTNVTDDGLKRLAKVTTLTHLNLSGTQITDAGLEYLNGMEELQVLDLSNTNVTDGGLERLAAIIPNGLDSGSKLLLIGTKTTMAGVKNLQQAWPKARSSDDVIASTRENGYTPSRVGSAAASRISRGPKCGRGGE